MAVDSAANSEVGSKSHDKEERKRWNQILREISTI